MCYPHLPHGCPSSHRCDGYGPSRTTHTSVPGIAHPVTSAAPFASRFRRCSCRPRWELGLVADKHYGDHMPSNTDRHRERRSFRLPAITRTTGSRCRNWNVSSWQAHRAPPPTKLGSYPSDAGLQKFVLSWRSVLVSVRSQKFGEPRPYEASPPRKHLFRPLISRTATVAQDLVRFPGPCG